MLSRARTLLFVVSLAALAAACGGTDGSAGGNADAASTPADDSADASFNETDITFLRGMIPHHQDAVAMAELVADHTDRAELLELADAIIATQQPEIDQMELLLDEAGAGVADGEGEGEGGHDMSQMGDLEELENLEGVEFDLAFIDQMTLHHEGAIADAETAIEDGQHPQVRALAEEIVAAQQAEIDRMAEWRARWAPDGN